MTRPAFAGKYVRVNGLRLHYQEWGDAGAPGIVLVHGWSTSAPVWHEIAEALSVDHHVIVPDNRGNGESEVPTAGYSISDFADDTRRLIAAAGLIRPCLVGSSWGGNIGTFMAAEHPQDISAAVLADPVYWKMTDAFQTVVPAIIARLERPEEELRRGALSQGASRQAAEREIYIARHFSAHVLSRVATENRDWALACERHLAQIALPTLVLVADPQAGGYIAQEELKHLRSVASPRVEFRLWRGVGHLMHRLAPERFIREVRAFCLAHQ